MEPARRRRRPAVSCILCRKRKIKCNRGTPCSNCMRSKNATCIYTNAPPPVSETRRQGTFVEPSQTRERPGVGSETASPLTPSTLSTTAPTNTAAETPCITIVDTHSPLNSNDTPNNSRTAPEEPTSACPAAAYTPFSTFTRNSRVETRPLNVSGDFYFHCEHRLASQPQAVKRSVTHKTRLFGPSHWANSAIMLYDMLHVLERSLRDETSNVLRYEKRCKALARIIKARRAPPWPCPPSPELPARAMCDALIERYLSTSEAVLRVLHIPSFRRDYEALWDLSSTPDPAFRVQLKLVLALGAVTYDSAFSLRPFAIRWIYEAQTWISAPEFKHQLVLPSLQTGILLHCAREAVGVGEDMVWAGVGTTLRMAMYMGLHRDPSGLGPKKKSPLIAEMRRRLWNTILELALQTSLTSGGPPLFNLDDFDTEPPGNFDDEQLSRESQEAPVPKPQAEFTQTTIAIALRKMLPQRLAIAKYINDLSSRASYAETLRLDAELREAYKTLTRSLHTCKSPSGGPPDFVLRSLEMVLRRYFLALHMPFFSPSFRESEFAYSRRVVVDTALRLWRAAFPVPLSLSPESAELDDPLARISTCGSGLFGTVAIQGFVAVAVELKTLIREEESLGLLGPGEVRPDLLLALQDFKAWSWKAMEAGETNSKVHLVSSMIFAQVEAVRKGLDETQAAEYIEKAAEEAEERSLRLLEEVEARTRPIQEVEAVGVGVEAGSSILDTPPEAWGTEDWDYMVSDFLVDPTGTENLSWVFQSAFG
ncbi:hypothetical protein C8A03DRAFT_46488 [Achaetomium macrosporum]|uniref:Zn(2)-C6 fungal-type domain-containing protein n=1 Tax=Achaetomium macrosporum TaxID=79813 RepID=A0AAN7C6L8_9PEZI|nr:hypothetical protein C8A03DRAFT_46488 [Achaetomium macrosporum]